MKALVVTLFNDGEVETEVIPDVGGYNLSAYAAAQVAEHPGRCYVYLLFGERMAKCEEVVG